MHIANQGSLALGNAAPRRQELPIRSWIGGYSNLDTVRDGQFDGVVTARQATVNRQESFPSQAIVLAEVNLSKSPYPNTPMHDVA